MVNTSNSKEVLRCLHEKLVNIMGKYGYVTLTPIQRLAIPKVLSCKNTLVIAPTGSGKTEAALFPVISDILNYERKPIAALYITPLRALNRDIFNRLKNLCRDLGISIDIRHGDTPQSRRRLINERPPHILVTTPETLSFILINSKLRNALKNLSWVIIDELHDLLTSKRGSQLLLNVGRLRQLSKSFRLVALSANISDIDKVKECISPDSRVCEAIIESIRDADIRVMYQGAREKYELMYEVVRGYGNALIFTNTRDEAEWLGSKLANLGLEVRVHHGSLSREERSTVEKLLKEGRINAVIATSSLELGIDVGYVPIVIQSSSPRQASKLLQRIGRSMHRIGMKAHGIIVTSRSLDDILESLVLARRTLEGNLEDLPIHYSPLDVLAHAIVGMSLEDVNGVKINDIFDLVRKVRVYENIDLSDVEALIGLLEELGYIKRLGDKIKGTEKGRLYYLKTTTIVDTSHYVVIDIVTNKRVGLLDEEFVILDLEGSDGIVLAGRPWRVVGLDDDHRKVLVEPLSEGEALIPSWVGETIPVHYKVAREVCGLRKLIALGYIPKIYQELIDNEALNYVKDIITSHLNRGFPLPTENLLLIEIVRGDHPLIIIHTCLGTNGNRGLGIVISKLLTDYLGVTPTLKIDPYRIILQLPASFSDEYLKHVIEKVFKVISQGDEKLVTNSLKRTRLFDYVLYKVLSRLGIVTPEQPRNVVRTLLSRFSSNKVVVKEVINEIFTRYVDINAILTFMKKLGSGKIQIKIVVTNEPSPLGSEGLKTSVYREKVEIKSLPRKVLIELIRRRIESTEITLICMMCRYSWRSKVMELSDRIKCPRCGYGLVAPLKRNSNVDEVLKIVEKGMRAGRNYKFVLSNDERKVFEDLMDRSKLVLIYGKKAVIALQGKGIGPKTAQRLLSELLSNDELYIKIYEFEKLYARTKRYWK